MDLAPTEDSDGDGGTSSTDARRWTNRPERVLEDDFTRGGGSPRPTAEPQPEPTRNPEQDWGVVLVAMAGIVIIFAGVVGFSVVVDGILGVLSVRAAVALALLLVAVGLVGLYRGWQAYHGR